jgi:hypothetical protein
VSINSLQNNNSTFVPQSYSVPSQPFNDGQNQMGLSSVGDESFTKPLKQQSLCDTA